MNGIHDLGGMHGFGPVAREANEPVFHAPWEAVVFAIVRAARTQRIYNIDESRRGIEELPPARYLTSSYYARWLAAAEHLFVEKGVLAPGELEARAAEIAGRPDAPRPAGDAPGLAERVIATLRARPRYERPGPAPRFAVGDPVRARNIHPRHHTRLPRYARGRLGTIDHVHGVFVFPDTNAHARGEDPQPLYSVRFEAQELWSDVAEGPPGCVYLDLWEPYLEPAERGGSR
jgi:nitrile hydratase subunit beta